MKILLIYLIISTIIHAFGSILAYTDEDSTFRQLIDNHKDIYKTKVGWLLVMILGAFIGITTAVPQLIYAIFKMIKKESN